MNAMNKIFRTKKGTTNQHKKISSYFFKSGDGFEPGRLRQQFVQ